LKNDYVFYKNGEFQVFEVLKNVVLTNFEDKDDFHFFQELKKTIASAPPSSTIPSRLHFVPSFSTSTILIQIIEPKKNTTSIYSFTKA